MTLNDLMNYARRGIALDSISGVLSSEETAKAFEDIADFELFADDYMSTPFDQIRIDRAI